MTNNPTIDGVPRELTITLKITAQQEEDILRFFDTCEDNQGYDVPKPRMKSLARLGVIRSTGFSRYEITGAGDSLIEKLCEPAPVVERQLVEVPVVGKLVPNGGGYDCWHPAANQGQAVVLQSDHAEYVAALQSTISQLQARVAELESGRGEPICYQARHSAEEPWFFTDKPGYWEWRPLFTAPPAPVAVVPDERAAFDAWAVKHGRVVGYNGWRNDFEVWQARACLDATAALNGPAK